MHNILQFTVVSVVDNRTWGQFVQVLPTWRKNRPELFDRPWFFITDTAEETGKPFPEWIKLIGDLGIGQYGVRNYDKMQGYPQRERMLTAFIMETDCIYTPYWLKLDTDMVAMPEPNWIIPKWFDGQPALIAPPWGYTKPAEWCGILEEWGSNHPILKAYPELEIPKPPEDATVCKFRRICSPVCFVNSDFNRDIIALCGEELPVPSHDTVSWYIAARMKRNIVSTREIRRCWEHRSSNSGRTDLVTQVMG